MTATQQRIEAWMTGVVSLRLSHMTPDQQSTLRKALQLYRRQQGEGEFVNFVLEAGDWMHIPRGWYYTHGARYPFLHAVQMQEGRSGGSPLPVGAHAAVTFGQHPFPPGQPRFIEDIVAGCQRTTIGGLAQAPTRGGKTLCSIEAACRLGGSTLVLVDRELLARQWEETIREHVRDAAGQPVPVGMIRGDRFDLPPDYPFVIGMMQTLARRQLTDAARQAFRTVILDEADIAPCGTALGALRRFSSRYTIGLSATPDRKDGLGEAILWVLGPPIAKLHRALAADVWFRPRPWRAAKVPTKKGDKMRAPRVLRGSSINTVEVERSLVNDPEHIADVVGEAVRAYNAGRQVLILVGLRDHVRALVDACRERGLEAQAFMGGKTDAESMKGNPVVATYSACAKGGDFKPPPTLVVLAAPRTDVRQAYGRGLQPQAPHKPIILDYVYQERSLVKQAYRRLRQYRSSNFTVRNGVSA